jgi:hypothetical protein
LVIPQPLPSSHSLLLPSIQRTDMLRPTAVQEALATLIESPSIPADSALIVFSDSGSIYAQASSHQSSQIVSTSTSRQSLKPINDSQRLQRARKPGLVSLLGPSKPSTSQHPANVASSSRNLEGGKTDSAGPNAMELQMNADERSKIIGALACRSWNEETSRIRRLLPKQRGILPSGATSESGITRSFSASTGGGNGIGSNGGIGKGPSRLRRLEQNGIVQSDIDEHLERLAGEQAAEQEPAGPPVAIPGTSLIVGATGQHGIAPLLLESDVSRGIALVNNSYAHGSLSVHSWAPLSSCLCITRQTAPYNRHLLDYRILLFFFWSCRLGLLTTQQRRRHRRDQAKTKVCSHHSSGMSSTTLLKHSPRISVQHCAKRLAARKVFQAKGTWWAMQLLSPISRAR